MLRVNENNYFNMCLIGYLGGNVDWWYFYFYVDNGPNVYGIYWPGSRGYDKVVIIATPAVTTKTTTTMTIIMMPSTSTMTMVIAMAMAMSLAMATAMVMATTQ